MLPRPMKAMLDMGMVWGRVSEPVSFAEIALGCKPGNYFSKRVLIQCRFLF